MRRTSCLWLVAAKDRAIDGFSYLIVFEARAAS
jgi:hypothetical protein